MTMHSACDGKREMKSPPSQLILTFHFMSDRHTRSSLMYIHKTQKKNNYLTAMWYSYISFSLAFVFPLLQSVLLATPIFSLVLLDVHDDDDGEKKLPNRTLILVIIIRLFLHLLPCQFLHQLYSKQCICEYSRCKCILIKLNGWMRFSYGKMIAFFFS